MEEVKIMCRTCMSYETNGKLAPIFAKDNRIAEEIFLICGFRILELDNCKQPALICLECMRELSQAIKFRNKCLKSQELLKNSLNCVYSLVKSEKPNLEDLYNSHKRASGSKSNKRFYRTQLAKVSSENHHLKQVKPKLNQSKVKVGSKQSNTEGIFKAKIFGLNCPYCNKYLTSKHSLSDHIRVRHEFINYSERFICDFCVKDFPLKYYLLRHIRATHLKTLSTKKKVEEHLPCCVCGKILKSKGNLSTHEKTHRTLTPEDYFYCDLCGNKFKGRAEMKTHIKKRHLYKIRYNCEICPSGKSWRTLFQLQRHVKVYHQNIREFKCEWCGKEFGEKNKLVCHVRIHTGEQPFKCSESHCNRAFTHQTDLRRHIWGHNGIRPYKCSLKDCNKGFMKKSELTAHEFKNHKTDQSKILCDY